MARSHFLVQVGTQSRGVLSGTWVVGHVDVVNEGTRGHHVEARRKHLGEPFNIGWRGVDLSQQREPNLQFGCQGREGSVSDSKGDTHWEGHTRRQSASDAGAGAEGRSKRSIAPTTAMRVQAGRALALSVLEIATGVIPNWFRGRDSSRRNRAGQDEVLDELVRSVPW